ncbi:RICIN domain-containing protein [Ohtaekwangia koreensis]|uniref:Por secretion system C-terminal sorting domain-containing protein n=1 Tax=Ohtaekwangia koreensis TaxID=688867 RepID=A0A1T5JSH7_9BACT|nr:RICIN domain-containing protein [Ohtaekwangia koreensis]SKC54198.1 Por secretion system C-terminal sorting domain-containing protein [Ohtaekwangia koreensis]
MKKTIRRLVMLLLLVDTCIATAQTFIHPGGLHTQADLDRMKAQVAAGAHPWIDDWNLLLTDPQAQNTYTANARANMGGSRQQASRDAHAAYLNTIRWYISGNTSYADCAVRICNAWSSTVNQVPTGTDIPGLSGIPIFEFAMVGEILRMYPGWASADFTRFKNMMINYFYPVCNDFLLNHNGSCISNYWSNWDICNIGAILTIGILCDDRAKYNQAVTYYQTGAGMGSIMNAVPTIHPGNLGQWQESGRDQEHAQLAVGMMASICEVAWHQGLDLYSYSNNRLLAGAEYIAQTNLWKYVPYTYYTNCQNANQSWISINGRGRLDDRPVWELIYNHYVVRKGLSAPNTKAMAQLMRPEHGSADHFGYGTLTFTQNASASPYPPSPVPPIPTGLTATAGSGRIALKWTPSIGATAQGYSVLRSTSSGGPYTSIASWTANTTAQYIDASVTNGTTYYYVVAAINQAGTSGNSAQVSAIPIAPGALPAGWSRQDIGPVGVAGSASYANVSNGTFIVSGSGGGIGGTSDSFGYTYRSITGDFTITARLSDVTGTLNKTGIMIRETLDPAAKTLIMKLGDAGWRQAGFGSRSSSGNGMTWLRGNDYTWLPAWFRLQRSGNTFTAYESSDGVTWFTVGASTVSMTNTCYTGLAACSGSTTALDNSTFDNVTIVTAIPQPIPNGIYRIIARNSGKSMDVASNSTANGANVQQWSYNGGNNQQWTLTYLGNNQYQIIGVGSGKSLDIASNSTADGANVQIWPYSGGNNQRFTITTTSGGYFRITPVHSGKALEIAGNSSADGGNVQQWTYSGGNNQQWQFVAAITTARIESSSEASVEIDEQFPEQVVIYPNPAGDQLTVQLGEYFDQDATIILQDSNGRTLYEDVVKGTQHVISLNKIPSGIYFVNVSNGNGKKAVRKLMKN